MELSSVGLLEYSIRISLGLPGTPMTAFSFRMDSYSTVMTEPPFTSGMAFRSAKRTSKVQPSSQPVTTSKPWVISTPSTKTPVTWSKVRPSLSTSWNTRT